MKISANWLRKFADPKVDDRQLAADLTMAGIAIEGVSGAGDATIFEAEITTNRPDAMNHYGIAREIAAIYSARAGRDGDGSGGELSLAPIKPELPASKGVADFKIEIAEPKLCARFTARVIRGVRIHASPEKVRKRFAALEQRAINNAADATNYTLLEMGHPTHAYDLDKLAGGKLIARLARQGETVKTLDGVERKLHPEDLVIADAEKPVGIAGVMGGYDSMITDATRNVLIEAAWFDPTTVRRTARRHGLHTDASHRFERGADFGATRLACARVAGLVLVSGGGELAGEEIDVIARKVGGAAVKLRSAEVERILGKRIAADEIERILAKLGFKLEVLSGHERAASEADTYTWSVEVPTWRLDVEREIDLIEEIARIHGYNNFPNTLPAFSGSLVELPDAAQRSSARQTLLALGYNEAMSLTFIAREDSQAFSADPTVLIANPLSEEAGAMRTTLLPAMLGMLARNLSRGTEMVRLFETGQVYSLDPTNPSVAREHTSLAMGATKQAMNAAVAAQPEYLLLDSANNAQAAAARALLAFKGDVQSLLERYEHKTLTFEALPEGQMVFHRGRSARALMDGVEVARFGQLHPTLAAARKIKSEVLLAELDAEKLFARPLRRPAYHRLSRYPAVERDFSFTFPDEVTFDAVRAAVSAINVPDLRDVRPAEIFRGGNAAPGNYSLLLRAVFQADDRTLRDDEVNRWAEQIAAALKSLGGIQRA